MGRIGLVSAVFRIEPVTLLLYVNGFSLTHDGGQTVQITLNPFSLIRNCNLAGEEPTDYKFFKVSVRQDKFYYFGVQSTDVQDREEQRAKWVTHFANIVRVITQSLFPPFQVKVDPLPTEPSTWTRLMAGYLVHFDEDEVVSVPYCELHAQNDDTAKLVLHENELCKMRVMGIYISSSSRCILKEGIRSSCFTLDDHCFSARTIWERKLWIRAISNLRVKLQHVAPNPTEVDLANYRAAIKEHIHTITGASEEHEQREALLQRSPEKVYRASNDWGCVALEEPPVFWQEGTETMPTDRTDSCLVFHAHTDHNSRYHHDAYWPSNARQCATQKLATLQHRLEAQTGPKDYNHVNGIMSVADGSTQDTDGDMSPGWY